MKYHIVILEPFKRPLGYEFDSSKEAENIAMLIALAANQGELERLGIPTGAEVQTKVVPSDQLMQFYDA